LVPFVLAACRAPDDPPPGTDGTDVPTGGTGVVAGTGDTAPPGPTGDTGPTAAVYDCATVPLQPTGFRDVPGARGYHDVAFDDAGYLIGQTVSGDLSRTDFAGNFSVWVPGVGTIQQMVWLPDGDLAVASDQRGIVRVAPSGASTVVNADIRPYGLILGPDGLLWSANQDVVHKVDPSTGDAELVVPRGALPRGSPRVINFDLGYTKLLIGTLSGTQGRIYALDLDADLDPVGVPYEFASDVGRGGYHDALGVDLCGYLYVADYETSGLYRISPDGAQVQTLLDAGVFPGLPPYGHGLDWGNGVGGWLSDAIYLSQPYSANHVMEVTIGVPSREYTGAVAINLP
jgi:hypothetical protein